MKIEIQHTKISGMQQKHSKREAHSDEFICQQTKLLEISNAQKITPQ